MFPDYGFDKLLSSARSDSPDRISRMLAACSSLRLAQRNDTINLLYASVCSAYSHYSVGAARIYLSLWRERNQFLLSTVGLLWLMHYPLTRMKALAETARRKAYFRSALDIHVGQLSTGENPCYSSEEDNNEQIKVMEYLS
jgi:hypothetical protein